MFPRLDLYEQLKALLKNQEFELIPFSEFIKVSASSKYVVRSGELSAYGNIIIVAASGMEEYHKGLNI